ncbi:uncharacterized protein LOC126740245 [Anthonomus grandis grandis]|uniref:uncharacterized protein LOC126740245 n=1 Tax=Anthonomus grandis grandis TaxID=2921223 RepID=UPI0021667C9A|nr:uncharacterized protein LOC126740245 [Anthonomus grandis grandis]
MYNNEQPDELLKLKKKTFFQKIFTTEYNIGFGTPTTDACSKCIELKGKVKNKTNAQTKNKFMTDMAFHKMRYKAFFRKLQEKREDLLTLSFYCQKNLVLPKVQDQTAYYSRQIYIYNNFSIVKGSSKDGLSPENVFCYTWMEHEHKKGANEIASAVFHQLSILELLASVSTIRLCADGCGGQNRNSIIIGMLHYFLAKVAPPNIKEIQVIFPITGHSFLPDRVFASIEKKLQHSTIFRPGTDLNIYDWKTFAETYFKKTGSWHFKFNEAKRFILTKSAQQNVLLRGETSYNSDISTGKLIVKKGIKIKSATLPGQIPMGVALKAVKIQDVKNLLKKHFGETWTTMEECSFYQNVLETMTAIHEAEDLEQDEFCEGHENEQLADRV